MKVRCLVTGLTIFSLLTFGMPIPAVHAAPLTSLKDTLSTLESNVVADHTIQFVLPTGVDAATDTISIDLTGFTVGSVDYTDIDLEIDGDANCDGTWTDKTLAAAPSTSPTWGAAFASAVLTLTAPTNATTGEITAGRCVQVKIGTNADTPSAGDQQLTSPNNQSTLVVEVTSELGTVDDSANLALDFVTDSTVNLTSVVDATLSFTISDTTIGFGSLSVSTGRWATSDAVGGDASATTPTAAHTMAIATNARTGWAITYSGATLTSTPNTIDATAVGIINEDSDGTPSGEQFGISASTDGDNGNITTGYLRDAAADFAFVAGSPQPLITEASSTDTETISVSYLANIAGTTEAGTYTTDITYVATATF